MFKRVFSLILAAGLLFTGCAGKKLSFFPDGDSRIAYKSDGKASTWWTRTSHTWQTDLACGFSPDGTLGAGEVTMENGVRPAFCLLADTAIEKCEVEGKAVYVVG